MNSRRDFLVQTAGIALGGAVAAGCKPESRGNEATQTTQATPTSGGSDGFDLEVTVTGLSLFLPWRDKSKMHVLMVAPVIDPGEGPDHAEPHYPRVFYDAGYDSQVETGKFWRAIPLESTVLDLSGFQSRDPQTPAIPEISEIKYLVDVREYASRPLADPEITPPPNLASRLTLPRGFWDTPNPSQAWELQGPPGANKSIGSAAWHVVWTIRNIAGSALPWALKRLDPSHPVEALTPLRPANGKVKLLISNSVRKESTHELLPAPRPDPGTPMPHFRSFRDLYQGRPAWPKLVYVGPAPRPGGTPYTCLPSGGK